MKLSRNANVLRLVVLAAPLACLGADGNGCRYTTPGDRAGFISPDRPEITQGFSSKPAAQFPAYVAAVRVQSSGYRGFGLNPAEVHGTGRYSVMLVRDVERPEDIQRMQSMPQVAGLISLSRLLLPTQLDSIAVLRSAAAQLKADTLLIYTFDTVFVNTDTSKAVTELSLGLAPTIELRLASTASALLVGVRTGFVYGAVDGSASQEFLTNAWANARAADLARRDVEARAFSTMVTQLEQFWPTMLSQLQAGR